jgi:hypothetical protein
MSVYLICFVLMWAILLAVWTLVPSFTPVLIYTTSPVLTSNGTLSYYTSIPKCEEGVVGRVALGLMAFTILCGVYIVFRVRNVPNAFNESRWISFAIYNWVVLGITMVSVSIKNK